MPAQLPSGRVRRAWSPKPASGEPWPSMAERLCPPMPVDRFWWLGWGGPLVVAFVAGLMRFWKLGYPNAVVFDETYYAKDAWSLLKFGVEHNWNTHADDSIIAGHTNVIQSTASFVVHPPAGKWVISLGEAMFGLNPFGWRFMTALLGTLAVLMVCRIGRRLFRSTLLGCTAGLLLSFDGLEFVMSRTALLDGILMFWILAAFGCLLVDRDRSRARLLRKVQDAGGPSAVEGFGPKLGLRPWRIAAGVCLGLGASTKWTGFVVAVFFCVLTLLWDRGARKTIGVRYPSVAALLRDSPWAVLSMLVVTAGVYLASWTGWFLDSGPNAGWDRHYGLASASPGWLPAWGKHVWAAFSGWFHYHHEIWNFNVNLHSPHPYQSNPWSWLVLGRPVSYYYESAQPGQNGCTSAQGCSREILALGTPALWWGATIALLYLVYVWLLKRDWRAGAILCGVLASYLPWFNYQSRTIFYFYAVTFVPFLALALTMAIGAMLGRPDDRPSRRIFGSLGAGLVVILVILNFIYFYPIYTAHTLPTSSWSDRMWLDSWI